jgi:phage terminase small subunit
MTITSQQEKFAQSVASGMNHSDAYRAAYNVKPTTKPNVINVSASKLMADPIICLRVMELRAPVVKAAQITLQAHLETLQELRNMASAANQYSAAITAEVARGKASSLYVEKSETKITGNIDINVHFD